MRHPRFVVAPFLTGAVLIGAVLACAVAVETPNDGEDEFETICGVSIPEETSRDRCRVVDLYESGRKVRTDLHFPDFSMALAWQPDEKVQVTVDGEDWGTPSHSSSEGETRFEVGRKTFYYLSDKEAARRELGS